jgi:hypothetical protein
LWFGEDEADVASAVEALSKIERDPERLIRGKAAEDFLHQLVS